MERTPITPDLHEFPTLFHSLLEGTPVYDSSSSPDARVWLIDRDGGLFLKTASKGSLRTEAEMTRFFHSRGLSAEVLSYESLESDWLLTARISGEDCLHQSYLDDPARLCDTIAEILRLLHSADSTGCPVQDLTARRLSSKPAAQPCDLWYFPSPEAARRLVEENGNYLRSNVLVHGDCCLPNILLDNWRFSGLIDLAAGGIGDRHMDLVWILWSLEHNLGTTRWRDRFLDAYGREDVEETLLRTVEAMEYLGI